MTRTRPWWHAAFPALVAAWVALAASEVIAYSPLGDAWTWPGAVFDLAVFVALAWHLGRLEDQHRDILRPPGVDRWGGTSFAPTLTILRPVLAFCGLVVAFMTVVALARDSWASAPAVAILVLVAFAMLGEGLGWNPVTGIRERSWPSLRSRWLTTMWLLALTLAAQLFLGAAVALALGDRIAVVTVIVMFAAVGLSGDHLRRTG